MATARANTASVINAEQRRQLLTLIDAVPEGADESDRAFVALLDAWAAVEVPYGALPVVRAYRCNARPGEEAGDWLVAGVEEVIADIRRGLRQ